ncbi:DNA (cytosine-5)-methyltransferase 1 [Variovorax boronicumulans]|uniref:DNA cytosine methyltransferase n=1 Tax=Variovorax boronicumulans TaxID=436515 RepID=UPI002784B617|nr:DNA cytosine methyltransferase [Variovorax boronicumulans]MDQ0074521.1 DNA (cytosine-5)-methyltransferase 1 [Variovorax boronicumulans]
MKIEAIDLFCGAGGLTRGLLDAGVVVKAGFDMDAACKHAYEHNNVGSKFHESDVSQLTKADLERHWSKGAIRLLAGCAPCQPFSTAANAARTPDDKRYDLLDHFSRLVTSSLPDLVTMENVPRVKNHPPFERFVERLRKHKYDVWFKTVSCTDVGVPQTRKRMVLLASRLGKLERKLVAPEFDADLSVRAAVGHLKAIDAGTHDKDDPIHVARALNELNLTRIRASKPGGTWEDWPEHLRSECHTKDSGLSYRSVYARMSADAPSPTITTQFFNFGTGRFGHPEQDRSLTPREAAILQSFPDDYQFVADGEPVYMAVLGRLIGNAVPPKLGEAIGKTLISHSTAIAASKRATARASGRKPRSQARQRPRPA